MSELEHLGQSEAERRTKLLAALAAEGASRCCYMPGAGNPQAWPTALCDCKTVRPGAQALPLTSEQTGCVEMRAYRIVAQALDLKQTDA